MFRSVIVPQASQDLKPVYLRKLQIEQDSLSPLIECPVPVRTGAKDQIKGLRPVPGDQNLIQDTALSEFPHELLLIVRIIFHEQQQLFTKGTVPFARHTGDNSACTRAGSNEK